MTVPSSSESGLNCYRILVLFGIRSPCGIPGGVREAKFNRALYCGSTARPEHQKPVRPDQANRVAASRIKRAIGKLRGHDFSAALKSSCVKSTLVPLGSDLKVALASPKS